MADGEIVTPASLIREAKRTAQLVRWDQDLVPDDILERAIKVRDALERTGHKDLAHALASGDRITRMQAMAAGLQRGVKPELLTAITTAAALVQSEAEYCEACNLALDGKTSRGDAFKAIKQMDDEARSQSRSAGRDR